MQSRLLISLTLLCVALGQSCDVLSTICSTVSCPAAVSLTVGSSSGASQTFSASEFNLISFGDFSINQGDVEGRVAVEGNFNAASGGVSIGNLLPNSSSMSYSLIVGGNANWVNGQVYPANAGIFVGGTFTGASNLASAVYGSCNGSAGCLNSQFSSLQGYFSQVSSALAARADSATVAVQYQQATVTCSGGSSVYSVSVSSDTFNSVTSFVSSGCNGATIIMNINGNGPVNFMGSPLQGSVIYNIPTATSVAVGTYVYGSIIAPNAALSQGNGTIAGLVVASSVSALVQVNVPSCPSSSTTGSAPSTTGAAAAATTGAAAPSTTGEAAAATTGAAAAATTGEAAAATTGAAAPSTTGAAVVSSTSGSTTGTTGESQLCTFLDAEAACPAVSANLGGSNYNFVFSDYDVVVFGDLSASSGDIEGRTFAYGTVSVNMFSFGLRASSNANLYTLIGGNLVFPGGSINNGKAFIAGSVDASSAIKKSVAGPCSSSNCLDDIKSTGQSCYGDISNTFANRSNVAVSVASNGAVTLTCNSASENVYYFSSSSVSMVNAASFTPSGCNANAIFVLSITGSGDVTFSGATAPAANVIYNIVGSRNVDVQTAVNGMILAPNANVNMASGVITGKVVAASAKVVQINIPDVCVSNSTTSSQSSSNANSGSAQTSAGINVTPSILVMLVAMFFAKMF